MSLPVTPPYVFGNVTSSIPLTNLDADFATIYAAVNGIGNGTVALANVTITGGTISNVSETATSYVATKVISTSSNVGAYSYGVLSYPDVNIFESFTASANTYVQNILQNTNSGTAASVDYVVSNNLGTATTYYGDYGMNGSGWTGTAGTNSFNAPNMVYLTSTTADLLIGTTTSNAVRFAVNGGADSAYISTAGVFTIVNDASIHGLTVGLGGGGVSTNTVVGASSLSANTSGIQNSAFGNLVLTANTTGSANNGFGYGALTNNTTGSYNTAYGTLSLANNTTASYNTAVGYQAGYSNTTGTPNLFFGYQSGYTNTAGSYNIFIGNSAGYTSNASGVAGNVCLGVSAGYSLTTGIANTFIGTGNPASLYPSGYYVTTGSYNTILGPFNGNSGGLDIRTASNYIVLSDGAGNPRGVFDGSGNFNIGTIVSASGLFSAIGGTTGGVSVQGAFGGANGTSCRIYHCDTAGVNSALTGMSINKVGSTGRSINAAGTINALGTDYAEYMEKAGEFTINKGDICGIDANGKLTNVFANAISFLVKSTSPSFVGGDFWGSNIEDSAELELARQTVDRIAFAGQVPVNVTGATVGQYIIPINNNGAISGQAISNPTFEQYQTSVGKVIAIEADGRAKIIVKVA